MNYELLLLLLLLIIIIIIHLKNKQHLGTWDQGKISQAVQVLLVPKESSDNQAGEEYY